MVGRFIGIPEVPNIGLQDWQGILFGSLKENVELLTGTRGETDGFSRAVVQGDIGVDNLGTQDMHTVTTSGDDGYTLSGQEVAALSAMRNLRNDVQGLANDLVRTRRAVDALLDALKGTA